MTTESNPGLVLVRYGELATKGKNRFEFENALQRNITKAANEIAPCKVTRMRGRMMVHPERRMERVARRLQDVFGIVSVSPAYAAERNLEAIVAVADRELKRVLANHTGTEPIRFRIASRRADKRFHLSSQDLNLQVADRILPQHEDRITIDLKNPELKLGIEVRTNAAYIFAERLPGNGGLPVGTLGRGICLLSGGIDSPVAAWMMMKRGCRVIYVSFHSAPFIGDSSKRKIEQLVGSLARYQPKSRLYSIPFTDIQMAIRDNAPESYRTVLYRRQMQKIAARVARWEKAGCLITGESLGQVASQTMENLTCIGAATATPVMQPLIGFDKQETIDLAHRIGTYELSIIPEPDCCTVFMPSRPIIRGKLAECEAAEEGYGLSELLDNALAGAERIDIGT
ncbi:MAG: thiamine biosynthesis protein ThiI [Planctomycetota bacterium]|jgi:thiamine biosynthesis protein ThiI